MFGLSFSKTYNHLDLEASRPNGQGGPYERKRKRELTILRRNFQAEELQLATGELSLELVQLIGQLIALSLELAQKIAFLPVA